MNIRLLQRTVSGLLFILLGLLTDSCFTINYSTTGASIPAEAETVSVQYIENQASYVEPGLSQQITDALKDYIQNNSRLVLVSGVGDLDFAGTIMTYDRSPTSVVAGDRASRVRFTISVRINFTSYVDSEMDFENSFSRYEDYDASKNFEDTDVKEPLTDNILELLIEDIYNAAFVNW